MSATRIGVISVVSVAIFAWLNGKTLKANVKPFR